MKFKMWFYIALFLFSSESFGVQLYSQHFTKSDKKYVNTISEINLENGSINKIIDLGLSYDLPSRKLNLKESPYIFFYTLISNHKALLQIIKKDGFEMVNSLEIDHINQIFLAPSVKTEFFKLNSDLTELIIHTGEKKNQHLLFVKLSNGTIAKRIKLNRYKNKVTVSNDQQFVEVEDLRLKQLTFISTKKKEVIHTFKLGDDKLVGTTFNNQHYFINFYERNKRTYYQIVKTNINTKKTEVLEYLSREVPIFTINNVSNQLLIAGTSFKGVHLMVHQILGSELVKINTSDVKFKVKSSRHDKYLNNLVLQGYGDMAILNLDVPSNLIVTDLPFDTSKIIFNSIGDLVYLKEGSGSEVAVVDVNTGELLERSGTGRKGVKFGQFIASTALLGVGASFGYVTFSANFSNTGFILNHNENKLYVINSKTNDVTHFNAKDLSDRKAIATGGGTFLVHQGNNTDAPLWVFSNKRITQISDQTFTTEKEIDYENIIGFDFEKDYFIIKTTESIITYDMKTGDISNQWPMFDADIIWSEK